MEGKSTDWVRGPSGPTVCRCCFAEGCYKDISTEYFWMGKREVYSEMLTETFDLSIAFAQTSGPNSNSRLICEPCISRLRDASEFKRQVQECEKMFMQYLDPGRTTVTELEMEAIQEPLEKEVKLEPVKLEKNHSDDDFDDRGGFDDMDEDDLDDQPLTKLASKVPKKESVDLLDLLDNAKAEKRKSSSKTKSSPAKKAKTKKETPKATASKPKPEKKKKGHSQTEHETVIKVEPSVIPIENLLREKPRYQRSARAEARYATKKNATAILECWSVSPFRWKRNQFKCAYCEASFTDCALLRLHIRTCSPQHSVKDIYSKFKEMSLINIDVTQAACRLCSLPYSDVKQMREHVIEHGYDYEINQPDGVLPFFLNKESWSCVICQETFNNFLKLYEHMNIHYQHYICPTCGKGYMTAPRLRKHSEVHISGTFPCNECPKVFRMRAARDYHKAHAHAKAPRYECPHCNMRFDGYYDRMNHLNATHSEKEVSYRCPHCELTFKTSGKRAIHVRSVHFPPQRDFRCTSCEWSFKTAYELRRHTVKHSGERNFHCNVCDKSFPRNRALRTHLKTHDDLGCKWCGAMFKQRMQLLAHMREVHSDMCELVNLGPNKI
ncbi:zinc finger protein 425-like isoform X8 [Cydia pomonella]|uniref:zinc finger protein 425-like isoform X8 n=1 Tax=Cydia pomonella TaxID=82600 RepID=UPI002ADD4121|nr:zinc finger protein 425-like isoform X8 [Cydia pomonella]